jgi:NADPH-dependent curcumin reductase CurA
MSHTAHEIHLASRPHGWPTQDNFAAVTTELPEPRPGQILVRNTYMSVDPYMRGRLVRWISCAVYDMTADPRGSTATVNTT